MISRIHSKLGTAGLVVAIVALVAALTGAAFAAGGGLTAKQKKEVKKIAKKYAGKPGPIGPQGAPGKDGTNGTNGTDGKDGTNGQSVTGAPIASGGACGTQTGVKYTLSGTSTNICNGATGFTETLPSGKTETGTWALGTDDGPSIVPLTFSIPLEEAPTAMHYVSAEDGKEIIFDPVAEEIKHVTATHCLGSADTPTAPAGELCIYAIEEERAGFPGFIPVSTQNRLLTTGATFFYSLQPGDRAIGTFAVTAAPPAG